MNPDTTYVPVRHHNAALDKILTILTSPALTLDERYGLAVAYVYQEAFILTEHDRPDLVVLGEDLHLAKET